MPEPDREMCRREPPNTAVFQGIHPTAVVGSNVKMGAGVSVGPCALIADGAVIGDKTQIGPSVFVGEGVTIGTSCRIFNGVVIGTEPQDLKFNFEYTTVEIGDGTILREYCTIHRGSSHRRRTAIGKNCYLMAYCHLGHDCILGDHIIMANGVNLGGHVEVGNYTNIGAMVGVHQFGKIGEHSFIAGGYRVVKDVPPFVMSGGDPLAYYGLNVVGLTRRGIPKETLKEIKSAYQFIYRSGLNVSQAMEKIRGECPRTPEIEKIISFIEKSERGIIPSGSKGRGGSEG